MGLWLQGWQAYFIRVLSKEFAVGEEFHGDQGENSTGNGRYGKKAEMEKQAWHRGDGGLGLCDIRRKYCQL